MKIIENIEIGNNLVVNDGLSSLVTKWQEKFTLIDEQELENLYERLSASFSRGIEFSRVDKNFVLQYLPAGLESNVIDNISRYPQLEEMTIETLSSVVRDKLSLAIFCEKTHSSDLVAYLGANPEGAKMFGYWEVRSAITGPNYRNLGLFSVLKEAQMLNILLREPHLVPLAFADDIPPFGDLPAIKSLSMVPSQKLGLLKVSVADLAADVKDYLVGPCPEGRCSNKEGSFSGLSHCDCVIWLPSPDKRWPDVGIWEIDAIKNHFFDLLEI